MKPVVLYYSDCPFFAGCENMLANFFNSRELLETYELNFLYRSSPAYERGMNTRISAPVDRKAIHILDHYDLYNRADSVRWKAARKPLKIIINLLLIKYVYLFINTARLRRELRQWRPDILHVNNGGYPGAYSAIAMVIAARLCGIRRIVFVVNNIAQGYRSPERWIDYFFDRAVIRGVSVFVTGSQYAGSRLHAALGVPQSRIRCIHNGIAPRAVTETRDEVIRRLGLPENRIIFSVIAVLEERKGQMCLLRALKLFRDRWGLAGMPFCIIEGTGTDEEQLKQFVRDEGLDDSVRFIAHEPQIFNLINTSDFIVLPSVKNEDFPNIILESMSLGKPVIASEFSGIPEQIEHMKSGMLVKPKDVPALMDAIKILTDSKDLRTTLGNNAKMRFDTQFTDTIAVRRYDELYRQLLTEMPV